MKKFLKTIIILIVSFILINMSHIAYADENKSNISVTINPSYVVTMPSSISIPFSNKGSFTSHIDFSNLFLDDGYGLKVTLSHNNFKSLSTTNEIPYNLYYNEIFITEKNPILYFTVLIDDYYLNTFPSGTYNSTIIVKIQYVKL